MDKHTCQASRPHHQHRVRTNTTHTVMTAFGQTAFGPNHILARPHLARIFVSVFDRVPHLRGWDPHLCGCHQDSWASARPILHNPSGGPPNFSLFFSPTAIFFVFSWNWGRDSRTWTTATAQLKLCAQLRWSMSLCLDVSFPPTLFPSYLSPSSPLSPTPPPTHPPNQPINRRLTQA